jgi:hypothetical protein
MTTDILLIDRRLTDPERELLCRLAIETVVEQTSLDWKTARATLGDCAERGEVVVHGDAVDVRLEVAGWPLVRCTREWLAFTALAECDT